MRTVSKTIGKIALVLAISFCINTTTKAQSPADDPGIGGPGSPSVGVGGDGGPVVPLDGGMSLMLLASGIGYGAKKLRRQNW
jgi:hypothetical protein